MIAKSLLEAKNIENLNVLAKEYLIKYNLLNKKMLDIGGVPIINKNYEKYIKENANWWQMDYYVLDLTKVDFPNYIHGDITNCPEIKDESYDFILCMDTFEHIKKPWLASKEITRLLKKQGICVIWTHFSWRYHICPVDYWRFTPECLAFLFRDLECLEANWDIKNRRGLKNIGIQGDGSANDIVPVDELGAWRENWRVYYVGYKK